MKLIDEQPTALVVENDTRILQPLGEHLSELGFNVFLAENSSVAEDIISHKQDFDLIILDLYLSDVADGWRFFNACDKAVPDTCARAIYTGHSDERIRAERSEWQFFEKGSGTAALLDFAKSAYSKAQLRKNSLPPPNKEKAKRIVNLMQPENWKNLYILGCFDRRVTLYSQQARALNLIRALFELGWVSENQSLAVIGAGVAGATAAIAAALLKCNVTLFESEQAALHLQASATHRYLHPHIYDWPESGSLNSDAGLPFLNWSANTANRVVQTLSKEFSKLSRSINKGAAGRILLKTNYRISRVEQISESKIRIQNETAVFQGEYDTVILAIGFGVELEGTSYWSGDILDGPFPWTPYEILISGNGDGGLIDLARATLRTDSKVNIFRHDQAVKILTRDHNFEEFAKMMAEADERVSRKSFQGNVYQEYLNLPLPNALKGKLVNLKRTQTKVTFHCHRSTEIFTLKSALLNRLLAFLLLQYGLIDIEYGEMQEISTSPTNKRVVGFQQADGTIKNREFDLIVKRYGPPKDYFERRFTNVYEGCGFMKSPISTLRLTDKLDKTTLDFWKIILKRLDVA